MARGLYTVSFAASAQTAAIDFFELISPSTMGIALHAVFLSQTTEVGDAQEEMLNVLIQRGVGTVTSGNGSAATPAPVDQSDAAATFTAETVATTQIAVGTGTLTALHREAFNVRSGWQMIWTPETRPRAFGGARLAIGLVSAPADSVTWVGTAYVEEL